MIVPGGTASSEQAAPLNVSATNRKRADGKESRRMKDWLISVNGGIVPTADGCNWSDTGATLECSRAALFEHIT